MVANTVITGSKGLFELEFCVQHEETKEVLDLQSVVFGPGTLGGLLAGLVFEAGTASPTNSARAASPEGEPAGVTFKSNTGAFGMRKSALKPLAVIAGQIPAS